MTHFERGDLFYVRTLSSVRTVDYENCGCTDVVESRLTGRRARQSLAVHFRFRLRRHVFEADGHVLPSESGFEQDRAPVHGPREQLGDVTSDVAPGDGDGDVRRGEGGRRRDTDDAPLLVLL